MHAVCAASDYDAQTATCAAPTWEPNTPPSFLPDLTVAQGLEIAALIGAIWAVGFGAKMVRRFVKF